MGRPRVGVGPQGHGFQGQVSGDPGKGALSRCLITIPSVPLGVWTCLRFHPMKTTSFLRILVLLMGLLLVPSYVSAEELVLGHFMGTNHPMHREVFLPLAETLARSSHGQLTLRIVPDLNHPPGQYTRALLGEVDIAFGLPGYTPDRFPRTQVIELPAVADSPQEATLFLARNLDRTLRVEYPDTHVLSLWVNEAAVLLCRDRTVRTIDDMAGLRVRVADSQAAKILTLAGAVPFVLSADNILPAFESGQIDAALIGASGVLPFQLQKVAKSCTVGFPRLLTSFYLVMNQERWAGLSEAARGWLTDATGLVLGAVATDAYERSAQQGLEALRTAGVPVVELLPSEWVRMNERTALAREEILAGLVQRGIDGQRILDNFRPRMTVDWDGDGLEVLIYGAPGARYRFERSADLIDWHPIGEFFGSPDGTPVWVHDWVTDQRRFFRVFEVLQGSAEHFADLVAEQGWIAWNEAKSTGVGGMIVENATGRVIRAWGNRTISLMESGEPYSTPDPTNHGETQLVGWYFANRDAIRKRLGYLPMPSDLTVVTSLDPCAMCAGSLLTAGFNCGVLASDDSGGGVNWDSTSLFEHNMPPIQRLLRSRFGYYKVPGIETRSRYMGGSNVIFMNEVVSRRVLRENTDVFNKSLDQVGAVRRNTRIPIEKVQDPSTLPPGNPARLALTQRFPEALSLRLTNRINPKDFGIEKTRKTYYRVTDELHQLLRKVNASTPGSANAIAMIDPHGNLLGVGVDTPWKSPIATAMMNIVSDYSRLAFKMISEASLGATVDGVPAFKRSDAFNYLSPVTHNTFIFLKAPSPGLATTLKDLGIFGNASDEIFTYVEPPAEGTIHGFEEHVRSMPLYYQGEDLTPIQILPPSAELRVTSLADNGPGTLRSIIESHNASGGYHRVRFDVAGTIKLLSELPRIRVPITIDASKDPESPTIYHPEVGIDFKGQKGLRFDSSASGSQVFGLALGGASGYAIESETSSLELGFNRFGVTVDRQPLSNALGSIHPESLAETPDVDAWQSPLVHIKRRYDYDQPLTLTSPVTLISATRVDSVPDTLRLYYRKGSEKGPIPPGFPSRGIPMGPATPDSLSAAVLGRVLDNPKDLQPILQAFGKAQGGQANLRLEAGDWAVSAELEDGTELTMSWLDHSGNTLECEFILHPELATEDPGLEPYLGKIYRITLTLASPGANTRSQSSEVVAEVLRFGIVDVEVAMYPVDDPLTGAVGGLLPNDPGYNEAAVAAAKQAKLYVGLDRMPERGKAGIVSLPTFNPDSGYGMLLIYGGSNPEVISSYEIPKGRRVYPFLGFRAGRGRVAIGIETDPVGSAPDFADLIVLLPDRQIQP